MSCLACYTSKDIESRRAVCGGSYLWTVNIFWGFVANRQMGKIPACVKACVCVCV